MLEQGEILFDGRMEEIYALFEEGMDFEQIVIRLFQRGKRL